MEQRRSVHLLQRIGPYWLLVVECNPNVVSQRFVKELCGASSATLKEFWNRDASVTIGLGEGTDWVVIGTQWKDTSKIAPQTCMVQAIDNVAPAVEKEWAQNRRVLMPLYFDGHWLLLNEVVKDEDLLGQQIVKTAHWPGDEIQQIWAQGKRIQCLYGSSQDWTIIAEKRSSTVPPQVVQAGPDPDNFNFAEQLSMGYRLIGASYQPTSKVYSFLWEQSTEAYSNSLQEIYFQPQFPSNKLSELGYYLESR